MNRRATRTAVAFWLLLALLTAGAQATAESLTREQAAAVDAAVEAERLDQEVVGLAIGILRDGRIAYLQGYGLADREAGTPVTTETVFNLASNSKPLAAVAAMQLVDAGLLDLDADFRDYLPEYPDPGAVITTRHLLSHQGGIPHYSNGAVVATERAYTVDQPFLNPEYAMDRFNRSPLLFEPGTDEAYTTYGYIVLSAVVQAAGGIPYGELLEERIARPLGIASLTWDVASDGQTHWAAGYRKNGEGDVVRAPEYAHYWKHGGGGHKMNIHDFARFAEALLNRTLLSEEAERAMWTQQATANGEKTNRGLGFVVDHEPSFRVAHNGRQNEATSRMVLYPDGNHGIVVITNSRHAVVGRITTAIYRALRSN